MHFTAGVPPTSDPDAHLTCPDKNIHSIYRFEPTCCLVSCPTERQLLITHTRLRHAEVGGRQAKKQRDGTCEVSISLRGGATKQKLKALRSCHKSQLFQASVLARKIGAIRIFLGKYAFL